MQPIHIPGATPPIPAIYTRDKATPGTEPLGSIGQYRYIWARASRKLGDKTIIVAIYGAYDALGLIGSESNGLVILNDTDKQVVADQIEKQDSGWYGASTAQAGLFVHLLGCPAEKFLEFVRAHPRYRGGHAL